jgi:hypothetical protein
VITIRLSEEDRKLLDAPEQMTVDPQRWRLADVRLLEQAGFTVETLADGLKSEQLFALAALCWVALRRHGVDVSWQDFDLDFGGVEVEVQGEASAPDGASTPK